MFEKYGVRAQYHPHADSHVDTEENIYRFLDGTDSEFVNLCLDTGHISYCGGDNLAIIDRAPARIGYLHLKQVDPEVRAKVEAEDLPFGEAVKLGAMTEPPRGIPEMPPLLDAVEKLGIDVFAIVEQDMYPCEPDQPLPIAQRTRTYFGSCGVRREVLGAPKTMSDLRIAVLGVGVMGADHVARITSRISGARSHRSQRLPHREGRPDRLGDPGLPRGRRPARRDRRPTTSTRCCSPPPAPTHEKQLLACLEHGKPVLCEKPLTTDVETSLEVVRREAELGKPLIQVGFMRRFDPEYMRLKALIDGGELGQPLVMHCVHRNPSVPAELRQRDDRQGLAGPRGRRDALPVRRGDRRRCRSSSPRANPGAPRGPCRPSDRDLADGLGQARRRRAVRHDRGGLRGAHRGGRRTRQRDDRPRRRSHP